MLSRLQIIRDAYNKSILAFSGSESTRFYTQDALKFVLRYSFFEFMKDALKFRTLIPYAEGYPLDRKYKHPDLDYSSMMPFGITR